MKIASWVKTAGSAAFPFTSMPAYTVIPMIPCLFYLRPWTATVAFIFTLLTWYMAKKGRTLVWMHNRLMGRLSGNRYSARPVWFIRRFSFLSDPSRDDGIY